MGLTKENYYDDPRLSQSQLKLLLAGPRAFLETENSELFFEEKEYFVLGSAIDTYLTNTLEFNDKYYISLLESKPSDVVKSIIQEVYSNAEDKTIDLNFYSDLIYNSCESHNYYKNLKAETRINKIIENSNYWDELVKSEGKTILSQEESLLISRVSSKILDNQYTYKYFKDRDDSEVTILKQLPIGFKIEGIECKALLDIVYIDHTNKTITPLDLKTMSGPVINFYKSVRKSAYHIQAAWYTEAINQWKEENYRDYVVENFKFIVVSTTEDSEPVIYTCDKSLLLLGKYGRPCIYLQGEDYIKNAIYYERLQPIKGYINLINDYIYYMENGFNEDRVVREGKDNLVLDWSGIIPLT